ncbi:uncharacterized protein LOC100116567 [Nasonia vitripennis]|uniref:CHK kinase-like domain-containing protein n=1 Tax=Nasonia vitripennis TaxID=7425 RepID=A0A7M7G2L3_NASVI|nr:uncharacterized protein LOC100116567 [Nasonia vitripennis]
MSSPTIFESPVNVVSGFPEDKAATRSSGGNNPKLFFRNVVSREEAKTLARQVIYPDAELVDFYLRPYSEEKLGFLGTHLCLIIVAKKPGSEECERRSFFVKTIPRDVPGQLAYIEEKGAFRKEVGFFKLLVPLLMEGYKGEPWAPPCYLIKEDTLVFEDMTCSGFGNRPRLFDEPTARAAVASLSRFHASSLLAEERSNGKPLNQLYPSLFEESEYKDTERSRAWFLSAINLSISVANDLGLDTSNMLEACKRIFDMAIPSKTKRNVVTHGDLWSSNLIFDPADRCIIVDFQLLRYSPLAQDLMQLIYLSTTREFRRQHETQLIKHYYESLEAALKLNGFKGPVPSFQELMEGVEEQRFPSLVSAVINFPTIMMDGKIGAEIMNGLDAYESYFFVNRKPFVDKIVARDPEYGRRVVEVVKELAEMVQKVESLPRPK